MPKEKEEYNPRKILREYKTQLNSLLKTLRIPYSQFKEKYPRLEEALDDYKSNHSVNLATRGFISDLEKAQAEDKAATDRALEDLPTSGTLRKLHPAWIGMKVTLHSQCDLKKYKRDQRKSKK